MMHPRVVSQRTQELAKPGQMVEFLYLARAIECLPFCDAESVDEATVHFARGTVGTVMKVILTHLINGSGPEYILMIDTCTYYVSAKHTRIVTKYEGSIQEELDTMEKSFDDL